MIANLWIEKQVAALSLAELKSAMGRQRLRLSRGKILGYVLALWEQHRSMRHFKAIHHANASLGVGYPGFMHGCGVVAGIFSLLEERWRQEHGIGFDRLTAVDSSLIPRKNPSSITRKDWARGQVTVRPDSEGKKKHICGEKLLAFTNSHGCLIHAKLLPSINSPDDSVLKHPLSWARKGLKHGVVLMDRGFGNKAVSQAFAGLGRMMASFTARPLYPPRKRQKWVLTKEDKELYRKRWQIEEVFRQLKDPLGAFRLVFNGVRRRVLLHAKVAMATLAWNMSR